MAETYKQRMLREREEAKAAQEAKEAMKKSRLPTFKPTRNDDGTPSKSRVRILPSLNGQDPIKKSFYLWELLKLADVKYPISEPYATWDVENPIQHLLNDIKKSNFDLYKSLRPNESYNVIVLDRANEDAGPQIWPLSYAQYKELEGFILDNSDYEDEDLFDLRIGFDFEVTTKHQAGPDGKKKMFGPPGKAKPVYETKLSPLNKSKGPVFGDKKGTPDQERIDALMAKVPDWMDVFPVPEMSKLEEIVDMLREKVMGEDGEAVSRTSSNSSGKTASPEAEEDDNDRATADEFDELLNS
jgi:hypothetical protein